VLKENGAKSVLALVTHGILSGSAIETLNGSVLSALVVTNTVPLGDKVDRVSVAALHSVLEHWLTSPSARSCVLLTSAPPSQRYVSHVVAVPMCVRMLTLEQAIRRTHNGTCQPSPVVFPLILTLFQASRFRTYSPTPRFKLNLL
jgi:hypothetical protein